MGDQTHPMYKNLMNLKDLIGTTKLIKKFLLKQMDIDKILDIIKRKVLKGTHLPLTNKEIQADYLNSPLTVLYLIYHYWNFVGCQQHFTIIVDKLCSALKTIENKNIIFKGKLGKIVTSWTSGN